MDINRAISKGRVKRDLSSVLTPNKADDCIVDHDELPPAYTELPDLQVLPSYLSACPLKPHRPFPDIIRAHHRLSQLNSITLSGQDKERLYYVEVHKGFQRLDPLGYRAGVLLRNGPHSKDEVLAAAGEETQSALRIYAVPSAPDSNSVFFLPPMAFGTNSRAMTMERMRPGTLDGGTHTFTFFVEIEPLRSFKRQKFEWVQDMDHVGASAKACSFKLVRVMRIDGKSGESETCKSEASSSGISDGSVYGETVATLVFPHSTLTSREAFTLKMLGSAKDGRLGERAQIAIVVTALRLWHFLIKGQLQR